MFRDYGQKIFFLGIKLFFIFQDRKLKLSASVWKGNLTKFQLNQTMNRKWKQQLSEWSEWVEILQGFTKFYFKQMLKVSAFYLENQKSFIPKVCSFSFKKCCHFCWNQNKVSQNDNTFERNEECATVFLKWTDFKRNIFSALVSTLICQDRSKRWRLLS